MKRFCLFLIALLSILVLEAEPYRPYPVIMVHGYNAKNYEGTNFGITILSDINSRNVTNPTTPSPVPAKINNIEDEYYISRNEGEAKTPPRAMSKTKKPCAMSRGQNKNKECTGELVRWWACELVKKLIV